MTGWPRRIGFAALLLAALARAGSGPQGPVYTYEVLVIGGYPSPLPREFAWMIAHLGPDEVLLVNEALMGDYNYIGVGNAPELHCRIREWKQSDCTRLRQHGMTRDGELRHYVIRTGPHSFKELRIHEPEWISGFPDEIDPPPLPDDA